MADALAQIRDKVAQQAGITPQHIGIRTLGAYAFLMAFASPETGEITVTDGQAATLLRCEKRTVKRAFRNLARLGIITQISEDTYRLAGYPR